MILNQCLDSYTQPCKLTRQLTSDMRKEGLKFAIKWCWSCRHAVG